MSMLAMNHHHLVPVAGVAASTPLGGTNQDGMSDNKTPTPISLGGCHCVSGHLQ